LTGIVWPFKARLPTLSSVNMRNSNCAVVASKPGGMPNVVVKLAAGFPIVNRVHIRGVFVVDRELFRRGQRADVIAPGVGIGVAASHRVVVSRVLLGSVLQFGWQLLPAALCMRISHDGFLRTIG
jgi:hypothetical protein